MPESAESYAKGTHQVVDGASGDPVDIGLLYHGHQRLLGRPAWFQEGGEVAALAQFGDVQADRARPGVPLPWPVAVALVLPVRAALVVSRAAHGGHLNVHQPLRGIPDQLAQEIRVIALGDRLGKVDHGLGHRVLICCRRSLNNLRLRRNTVAASPAARCATLKGAARGLLHHPVGHYPDNWHEGMSSAIRLWLLKATLGIQLRSNLLVPEARIGMHNDGLRPSEMQIAYGSRVCGRRP